jgi:hypothetical protein
MMPFATPLRTPCSRVHSMTKMTPDAGSFIGADPAGRLLELVLLIYDDGYELIIHAMKARTQHLDDLA